MGKIRGRPTNRAKNRIPSENDEFIVVEFAEIPKNAINDGHSSLKDELSSALILYADIVSEIEENFIIVRIKDEYLQSEAERLRMWKTRLDGCVLLYKRVDYAVFEMFSPSEKIFLSESFLRNIKDTKKGNNFGFLIHRFECTRKITHVGPLHLFDERQGNMWSGNSSKGNIFHRTISFFSIDVNKIEEHFGASIAIYFGWMSFYTFMLIFPALAGLVICLLRMFDKSYTEDNDPYVPFFSLFVVLWAVLFQRFWKRQSNFLACKWKTLDLNTNSWTSDVETPRPNFRPDCYKINELTGVNEPFYPYWKTCLSYVVSGIVTCMMLCVAFAVMACSLNLQGYIHDSDIDVCPAGSDPSVCQAGVDDGGDYWTEKLMYIPFFAKYSSRGAIFDQQQSNPIMPLVPVVIHVSIILILNKTYQLVAGVITEWENHVTQKDFMQSLILKRFCFEAFDCYIALFYLAFMRFDLRLLRIELVSLYTTDSIRRLALETLLPAAKQYLLSWWNGGDKGKEEEEKHMDEGSLDNKKLCHLATRCLKLDEYEQFDDYLEMQIEFGYVTLFASAFPLAALLSIFCHFVEIKSDLYKLLYLYKRPSSVPSDSIGIWEPIMACIAWMSILTNCLIFGLSSRQMMMWFPDLFVLKRDSDDSSNATDTVIFLANDEDEDGAINVEDVGQEMVDRLESSGDEVIILSDEHAIEHAMRDHKHYDEDFAPESGQYVIGLCFGIEHAIMLLALLMLVFIPPISNYVLKEMKRRQFNESKQAAKDKTD